MKTFYYLIPLLICGFLHAQESIEVSADHIITDQATGKSIISGNVKVQRHKDYLNSQKVIFYFNPQTHRPTQYEAYGDVTFQVILDDGRMIFGKADQAVFSVASDTYKLIGNALVEEKGKSNQVRGDMISLNRKSGSVNVEGKSDKPAKVIFLYDNTSKQPVTEIGATGEGES